MALKKHFSLFLISVFFIHVNGQLVLPSTFQKCNVSGPNFNTCAVESFGKLIPMIVKGIPSLGIATLDPTYISHACFRTPGGIQPISLAIDLWNFTVNGLSDLQLLSTEGTDLKYKNVMQLKAVVPRINIIGEYTMNGKILAFPLTGTGVVDISMSNVTIDQQTYHQPVTRNGKIYLAMKNITLDANISSGEVVYTADEPDGTGKSFGLSDVEINEALNRNFMTVFEEYANIINDMIVSMISPRMVRFNNEVPFDDILVK